MKAATRRSSPEVLYLDTDVAVIAKPARMATGAGRPEMDGVLDWAAARSDFTDAANLKCVNSLHEQASGVVLYARTPEARLRLSEQFSTGQAFVTYLALVSGYVEDQEGDIGLPLLYDKRAGRLIVCEKRGTPACTHYRIEQRVAGATLLECRPAAERHDQLRVHLAAINHPLAVDPALGGGEAIMLSEYKMGYRPSGRRGERPLIDRLTLHAASIEFRRPSDGEVMVFSAPLPKDMSAALTQLGRLV